MIKLLNESVSCPVIANGDVKTLDDCYELQRKTNCRGSILEMKSSHCVLNSSGF